MIQFLLLFDLNTLHTGAKAGVAVQCEDAALRGAGAVRRLIAAGEAAQKELHGLLGTNAQHRLDGAGHAQIRDVAGALGEHAVVGGGHVGVSAPERGDAAIQIVGHGQLLAGGLGVELHQREGGLVQRLQQAVRRGEGVVGVEVQIAAADEHQHRHGEGPAVVSGAPAASRSSAWARVRPLPEIFSPLTTVKAMFCSRLKVRSFFSSSCRPVSLATSPSAKMR